MQRSDVNIMALYSVYVTKLPISMTNKQLISLFSSTAPVADAYVCTNTVHTDYTFGFVRYVKLEDAKKAISAWNGAMYKEQRLLVEMSRHDMCIVTRPQDTGGPMERSGGRRSSGWVEDKANWQELHRTWDLMKAGDETTVHWNTLVKELTQINFCLVPPFLVDPSKESWSSAGDDTMQEATTVVTASLPDRRQESWSSAGDDTMQEATTVVTASLPESRQDNQEREWCGIKSLSVSSGGDANNRNCHASESSAAVDQHGKEDITRFDREDIKTELALGERMNETLKSHMQDFGHETGNAATGNQGSEVQMQHVEHTGNKRPVKLVSIGRGRVFSLQQ